MIDAAPSDHDRELALLAACLRPLAAPDRIAAIEQAAAGVFDSNRLIDLARRHRVSGFVERGFADAEIALPGPGAARLASQADLARLQTLRNAGEEVRVGRALAAAGIDALFVKGATLGTRLYGTPGLKTSWDVDVLVARDRMAAAGAVLRDLGYRRSILGGVEDPVQVGRFLAAHKEAEWRNEARGTTVELHTELTDNRTAIPDVGLGSPRQRVAMAGAALETLATGPLFAYLAYHGTGHLWARLKWLGDTAALLAGEDVAALHAEAVALGAGRTPGVAIVLAHELLGIEVPASLLARLRRDRGTARLVRYSRAAIAAERTGSGQPLADIIAVTRAKAWLVPGMRHRWGAIRSTLTHPYRPAHLAVPVWAMPAVILAMLPVRLLTRAARLRRQDQAGGNTAKRP